MREVTFEGYQQMQKPIKHNVFSLGSQVGGADAADATRREEQQLRDALNTWTGDYSGDIREFAFLLRVDGQLDKYTTKWNIRGAQIAKRKKDWIEVEIAVPEEWWREDHGKNFKKHLTSEIENGLHSMIEVLQKSRRSINSERLLADWERIKNQYLRQKAD